MFELKILLYRSIEKNGLTHPVTVAISQLLDKHIVEQQIRYNNLKNKGYIDKAIDYSKYLDRRAEIKELARRWNKNEQSSTNWKINKRSRA